MARTAGHIIEEAAELLNDEGRTRWTVAKHLKAVNAGQRALVLLRPDALAKTESVPLADGTTRQAVPAGGFRLIDIIRNMGADGLTPGAPVTVTDRDSLDDANAMWHTDPPAGAIDHFVLDDRNPTVFYVTPPPAGVQVEMVWSAEPAEITAPEDVLEVAEPFHTALVEYQMYWCYLNNEGAPDQDLAQRHLQQFYLLLGEEKKVKLLNSPNYVLKTEAANG